MLSAIVTAIAGVALITQLPLTTVWRGLLVVAWCGHCSREVVVRNRAAARVALIRVDHTRQIQVIGKKGQSETVLLLPGSLVLARLAWLRFRFNDDVIYADLLCGEAAKDAQWHRFQLIWRQSRQIVGRVDRS